MSEEFLPLDNVEVIELEYQPVCKQLGLSSYFKHLLLTATQFSVAIENGVRVDDEHRAKIFDDGLECEVLKLGSKDWQKGKIRVKVTVDFCPDEPE